VLCVSPRLIKITPVVRVLAPAAVILCAISRLARRTNTE
jgi:hypothetical protein